MAHVYLCIFACHVLITWAGKEVEMLLEKRKKNGASKKRKEEEREMKRKQVEQPQRTKMS